MVDGEAGNLEIDKLSNDALCFGWLDWAHVNEATAR